MKTTVVIFTCLTLAGCATAPHRTAPERVLVSPAAVTSVPQQVRGTGQRSADAMLEPGASYVASFPEADRRAACDRLNYRAGTQAYSDCLVGNFPENPYFSASAN